MSTALRMIFVGLLLGCFSGSAIGQGSDGLKRTRSIGRTPTGESVTFEHGGIQREYRLHVPATYQKGTPVPLVVCLHGGGGDSKQGSAMGLTEVADQHGFIVVYPNGLNRHWNDGRKIDKHVEQDKTTDDVDFIKTIVGRVGKEYSIDQNRIFATGVSNGGFMSQRLAIEASDLFSAVGIFIASMGEPINENFSPTTPVSVLFMNGTEDPLVPYEGGPVRVELFPKLNRLRKQAGGEARGRCLSTDEAVALWVKRNGLKQKPEVSKLADADKSDGSTVELSLWSGGEQGTAVALYKVVGGGHTVPGKQQYLPESLVGTTNQDVDGFEIVWKFFEDHARQADKK